ncbi:hypothetical protein, partial [Prevotella multiformis]|uniref:hypothetical protein n=1 Tax=Prevotella multiformis TaxID=282402 RepID=UPI0023F175FD
FQTAADRTPLLSRLCIAACRFRQTGTNKEETFALSPKRGRKTPLLTAHNPDLFRKFADRTKLSGKKTIHTKYN